MYVLGITGPIAAGKTTVMGLFAEQGAMCLAADELSREQMAPGSALVEAIAREFGPEYVDASGRLLRSDLGRRVFADAEALARLNSLTHPALRRAAAEGIEAARRQAHAPAVFVFEAAVMYEMGALDLLDGLLYVDAPPEVRLDRLCRGQGLTREEASSRMRAQEALAGVAKKAQWIVDGSLELSQLRERCREIYEEIARAGPSS